MATTRVGCAAVTWTMALMLAACSGGRAGTVDARVAGARASRTTAPGAPVDVQVSIEGSACVLSWKSPAGDRGGAGLEYVVTAESTESLGSTLPGVDVGTAATALRTSEPSARLQRVSGVPMAVSLVAHNAAGDSPASAALCPP